MPYGKNKPVQKKSRRCELCPMRVKTGCRYCSSHCAKAIAAARAAKDYWRDDLLSPPSY